MFVSLADFVSVLICST